MSPEPSGPCSGLTSQQDSVWCRPRCGSGNTTRLWLRKNGSHDPLPVWYTNHVEVFLIEATEDEEEVSTQFTQMLFTTHVLRQPLGQVTLGQEALATEQRLQRNNINTTQTVSR